MMDSNQKKMHEAAEKTNLANKQMMAQIVEYA